MTAFPTIEVAFTPTDAERAAMRHAEQRWAPELSRRWLATGASNLVFGVAYLALGGAYALRDGVDVTHDGFFGLSFIGLGVLWFVVYALRRRRSVVPSWAVVSVPDAPRVDLTIDNTGIEVRSPVVRSIAWSDVSSVRRDDGVFVVTVSRDAPIVVPREELGALEAPLWAALEREFVGTRGLVRGSSMATSIVKSRSR